MDTDQVPIDLPGLLDAFAARPARVGYWAARCPCQAHARGDRRPSLRLWIGRRGQLMIGCFRGCNKAEILSRLGLRMSDLWPRTLGSREESPRSRIVAVYDYRDESDRLLYQKVRMEPKQFRQRRPVDGGGWEWSLGDCRRVLYRLPEIMASDGLVVVVEGEKDADALHRIGYIATTNTEGAGHALSDAQKWRSEYSETLSQRPVVVIPDADEPGRSRAMFIVGSLLVHGADSVACVELPSGSKDLSEWIAAGATCRDFRQLIRLSKYWK